ncbi:hypothetical protein FRB94_013754 [Tulasnella sp. JGI-2019a]|nr:hypothetical protein FRB94_013754 [Tulasnella sp. JGI-2019a]KAG9038170.1 hypothetical protein FRB95_002610 [Tulasnella sp. JGI-2019a]
MPLLSRKNSEFTWAVEDFKEVAPVPAYFGGSGVEIVSIAQNEISHTYTFDAPSTSSLSSPSSANLKMRPRMSRTASSNGSSSRLPFLSRISSIASNESDDSSYSSSSDDSFSSTESVNGLPTRTLQHDHVCMRDALTYAREQLIKGSEMKKAGGNVLFCEGWQVTRLRKNNQYRLQVRYFGRPAKAVFTAPSSRSQFLPPSSPPFLDLLEDAWN